MSMSEKKKIKRRLAAALILLSGFPPLFAQSGAAQTAPAYSADMIKVYFFLIVVATIISRITQYLKLLLRWLLPKIGLMQRVYGWYWQRMKKRLQINGLALPEEEARPMLRKFIISVITYSAGIILGVLICVQFDIGVLKEMGFAVSNKTLDAVISGIAAGIGVEPVHSLFRLAEEKRRLKKLYSDVIGGTGSAE